MTVGVGNSIEMTNPSVPTNGILYAPDGNIALTNTDLYGSVAADLVTLQASQIQYPADLRGRADLPGAGLDTLTYTYK